MNTKKPLKIFIDGYSLNKEPQGVTTYIKELYKEIATQTPNILFFIGCFEDDNIKDEFKSHKNIYFIFYENKSRVYRMLFEIPKYIKRGAFDFAHFQYVIPYKRSKNCKYITTIHDVLFNDYPEYFSKMYRYKRNFLFYRSAKKTDFLLTVSDYSKKSIEKHYKLNNKNIFITPNGVNKSYFKSYSKETAKKRIKEKYGFDDYILYVSRIEPRKNQELLLKIYLKNKIYSTSTHLVFIGNNSIENIKLNKLVNSLSSNQKQKIHFFENIKQSYLTEFYKAAKIFVYPSRAEGFGIPPLEAGAFKIPVLCSSVTAMKSFNFFNPNFFNPNNEDEFQKKFQNFYTNYKSIDLIRIQNKIKTNYSWNKSAQLLTSIFNQNISNFES